MPGPDLRVVVLVPRRAGIEDRDKLWEFCQQRWAKDHPTWEIVEGVHAFGPFNRSAALNTAAAAAGDWDVAVLIDADVLADRDAVRSAVDVAHATNLMILAYHERVHLTPRGTEKVVGGYGGSWRQQGFEAKVLTDACSSAVVVSRTLWDLVGGFDEGFEGFGWEDVAFRIACETMTDRPMVKIASTLFHLHHVISHENNHNSATMQANKARCDRYKAAYWDMAAMRAILDDAPAPTDQREPRTTLMPRILHRTVPTETSAQVEAWWVHWRQLLPGWELMTHRDPLEPAEWPLTSPMWGRCQNGAQLAGLIRLEALWRWGGVYSDADVEPVRSLEPLLDLRGFAGFEDKSVIPDAVMGFVPAHPAVEIMLNKALASVDRGGSAWDSGPGVSTAVLRDRWDVLVLPPAAFYPIHYTAPQGIGDLVAENPWTFCIHRWHGSWLTDEQKATIARKRRA